jgi:hypothetical protein
MLSGMGSQQPGGYLDSWFTAAEKISVGQELQYAWLHGSWARWCEGCRFVQAVHLPLLCRVTREAVFVVVRSFRIVRRLGPAGPDELEGTPYIPDQLVSFQNFLCQA